MDLRRLQAICVLLLALAFAAPVAPGMACDGAANEIEACSDNPCDSSDCPEGTGAGGCAQCGQLGKVLACKPWIGLNLPMAVALSFHGLTEFAPEGFSPAIDQPPRGA